jgi:trehalose 6-phosphate synthase/phosphatase
MTQSKLIVVSNRLPVSVAKLEGQLVFSESSGGLATAMSSLGAQRDMVWIGWPGIASDDLTTSEKRQITRKLKDYNCVPVYLSQQQISEFYDGYANDTLWPLFHYFESIAHHNIDYWKAYQTVNSIFMRAVASQAHGTSTIWIQDYHLMLLPAMLRRVLPMSSIGFFLHIPFPSFELFRLLPERKEILYGLMGADLIGFHIYDYARHFLSSSLRLLGTKSNNGVIYHEGRTVKVDSFPIGIDYEKFAKVSMSNAVKHEAATLHQHHAGQKIILSVDRLDYTKGILQRLEAYDLLLQQHPRFLKKVCLMMIAVPSRIEVDTYKNLREAVEQAVSRINGRYGTIDWTPISYQFRNVPFQDLVALYAEADVALVTPLRDGMNLVAKEYIASKQKRTGVLVLSEMAGAIDEMPEALSVNPNDTMAITATIRQALTMPKKEQRSRLQNIQRRISSYTVQRWAEDFLDQLQLVKDEQTSLTAKALTLSIESDITTHYKNAKKRLLLLDYDGTLKGFTSSRRLLDSRPSKQLLALLVSLASESGTQLCIVSGRDKTTLEKWFGHTDIALIAEHGAWKKFDSVWSQTDADFSEDKKLLLPLLRQYADRTPGAIIEEKDYSLVWHYRDVPTELAYIRTLNLKHDLKEHINGSDIDIFDGNKIVEIKLKNITKGYAAEAAYSAAKPDIVIAIGDDYTDEDMFRALPQDSVTVHVGVGETDARYQLPTISRVISFLEKLRTRS